MRHADLRRLFTKRAIGVECRHISFTVIIECHSIQTEGRELTRPFQLRGAKRDGGTVAIGGTAKSPYIGCVVQPDSRRYVRIGKCLASIKPLGR